MLALLNQVFDDRAGSLRRSLIGIYNLLITANLTVWIWVILIFRNQPLFLGTALLAYGFGLRHAVDADHIAAIDNVTRKLMQEGKRPISVGFFFALGHSTVVILAAAGVAVAATLLSTHFEQFKNVGNVVSTSVSALFLFAIATANLVILRSVWRTWRHVRAGGRYVGDDFDILLNSRGLLARVFRPLFRLVTKSWHMFPLGFLFGLGFDTATEVALLGISATQATQGISIWSIMVFPALFATGMSLIDTTDGVVMLGVYNWAFVKPIRTLYYNLTITFVSVVVAFLVGGIEALGLIGGKLSLSGWFWDGIGALNENFNNLGFTIIGVSIAAWIGSIVIYRYKSLDDIPVKSARYKWCIRQVGCDFCQCGALSQAVVLLGSMAMAIRVRALSDGEAQGLAHMARSRSRSRSRTLGAGLVRRAQTVQHAVADGLSAPEVAAKMGLCGATVRFWLKRFNARGLARLKEDMRSERPVTPRKSLRDFADTAEERSAVITAALSRPSDLGLPFASWTLDRLMAYLNEQGVGMKRSRISEVLLAERLKWRQEETWFGARVDPEFTRKRGRSSSSTPARPKAASLSASTRWDRLPARATPASA